MIAITTVRLDEQRSPGAIYSDALRGDGFYLRTKLDAAYGNSVSGIADITIAISMQNITRHIFGRISHLHTNTGAQIEIQNRADHPSCGG